MAEDELVAKSPREKCMNKDARRLICNIEDLCWIWNMLDTCYERLEKYMSEALKPIVTFRRYKMVSNSIVSYNKDFCSTKNNEGKN
jgi:hypothetical protein